MTTGIPRLFDRVRRRPQSSNVSSLVQRNKVIAKRKGVITALTGAGVGVAAVAGAPVLLVVGGVAGAAYLAWDWFSFRVKNGMRF